MNKLLFFIGMAFIPTLECFAQNQINNYEYWFDTDYSAKTGNSVNPNQTINLQIGVSTGDLSTGLHDFQIRFKDTKGQWSVATSQYFIRMPLTAHNQMAGYEYWIDNDYAAKTSSAVSQQDSIKLVSSLNMNNLSLGVHRFQIRFRDIQGVWSAITYQYFLCTPVINHQITGYEYWFDKNYASKVSKSVTSMDTVSLITPINANSMTVGVHSFQIRFRDNRGVWSAIVSQYFLKTKNFNNNNIIAYRYWANDSLAQQHTIYLTQGQNPLLLNTKIKVSNLNFGMNLIHFQFLDSLHQWSSITTDTIYAYTCLATPVSKDTSLTGCTSVSYNGTNYTSGTIVKDTLRSTGGCDSVYRTATITISNVPTSSTTNASICSGSSYLFNGTTYATSGTYTKTLTNSNGCDSVATLVLTVNNCLPNYIWTGAINTDWSIAGNWTNNVLPVDTNSVIIPSTPVNQPKLSKDVKIVGIALDGNITINGYSFTINGAVTGTGSLRGSQTSSLTIGGNVGSLKFDTTNNSLNNLDIIGSATLGNMLNLYGTLSLGGTLNTGGNLVLKSISTGTAVVGDVTGSINGTARVERYIPKGYCSFRDLGVCVSGAGSIANTWGDSLDNYPTYSYDTTSLWSNLSGTTLLQPYTGYRVLVSGYKNPVVPTTNISYMNSAVTLAYSGTLLTGDQNIPLYANGWNFVSNPYASQVDFSRLTLNGLYQGYYYVDPTCIDQDGYLDWFWYSTATGASNIYAQSQLNGYLQPGQGFWVLPNSTSPVLTFKESAKSNVSTQTKIFSLPVVLNRIAAGLFANGKNVDGAVVVFNSGFSNGIGKEDGPKISNHGENLTFNVLGNDLSANGWNLPKTTDELHLHLYQLRANTAYTLRLDASQFMGNGLQAYLKDNVLNNQTLLKGDSNVISFATTSSNTALYSNRYSIVFGVVALPVNSINLSATKTDDNQVAIKWSVTSAANIVSYTIEKSTNGKDFIDLVSVNDYSYIDTVSTDGTIYYRIKVLDMGGVYAYSNVAVLTKTNVPLVALTVYPNPVTDNSFKLVLGNAISGKYLVRLVDKLGQTVYSTNINHNVATFAESLTLDKKLAVGCYILTVTDVKGTVSRTQLIIN